MDETAWDAIIEAPGFAVGVATTPHHLTRIEFLSPCATQPARTALGREAAEQLVAYLSNPRIRFDLPLADAGSSHQQKVWQIMRSIEPGFTLTYGDVAARIGSSPRAVGGACGANPFPVVIPCHRIVAAGGALGGFAHSTQGFLPGIKRWLLAHEAAGHIFSLSGSGHALS